jgi:glycosyltransferase involved in cell wall biosynthesis
VKARDLPRVTYWNNQAAPYFVRRMNRLHDRGNVAVEAWFSELRASDRDWRVEPAAWRFPARVLPSGRRRVVRAAAMLLRSRPDVFVTLYEDAAFAAVALLAKVWRIPVAIHAMRTFPTWRGRSLSREVAKHGLFRMVDAVQVPGMDSKRYAVGYGAAEEGVVAIHEEIDLSFWTYEAPRPNGRRGCTFLYVGRLWRGKGVESLLDAQRSLVFEGVPCSLVVVGAGEDEEALRAHASDVPGVEFVGFEEGEALRARYRSADAFVFPTLGDPYGYVVQEAMACGLPVISTTAAGDIRDRVVDGETGFLVPPGDAAALARRMRLVATDPVLRAQLGERGRARIEHWTTDNWAQGFEELVHHLATKSGQPS